MLVSWFGRLKPLEELWLIHDIPFAVPPLQPGCFWCVIFLAGSVDGFSFRREHCCGGSGKKGLSPVEGEVESVILREQDGRSRPVCLRDEPKPRSVHGIVSGNNPPALCQ